MAALVVAAGGAVAIFIIYLAVIVFEIAALWQVFVKAGQPGWKAIIPIYNYYIMLKIVGRPGWWLILYIIPLVNIIIGIIVLLDVANTGHPPRPHPLRLSLVGAGPVEGAHLGRPAHGPGSLADPGRRFGARMLDVLVLLPVFALLLIVTLLIAAPHTNGTINSLPTPGFVWVYLTVFACALATGLFMVAYETVATARYGRPLRQGVAPHPAGPG
jgi:hypothetical protein